MIAAGISTPGFVVVNGPLQIEAYRRMRLPFGWELIELPVNLGICGGLNWCFEKFPNEPWYGMPCDDELVFTEGFDRVLIDAAGAWNISHGNDGWMSETRLWTYATYGGDLLRAAGYWALPGLWHWYFDDHWELVAKEFSLKRHCREVVTEHRHVYNETAAPDATFNAGRSRAAADRAAFNAWRSRGWPKLRERISFRMIEEAMANRAQKRLS